MTRSFINPRSTKTHKRPALRPQAESLEGRLLLTAGDLDQTFGSGGVVLTSIRPETSKKYWDDSGSAVQVQPTDGRILVGGYSAGQWGLTRLNPNGQLDTSLDGDGRVLTTFANNSLSNQLTGMALQADGKIIVAGTVSNETTVHGVTTYDLDFGVVRYNTNGSLDTSFDGDGKATTNISTYQSNDTGNRADIAGPVTIQPSDGKILVGGRSRTGSSTVSPSIVRYLPDGRLDPTFDGDGKLVMSIADTGSNSIRALTILSEGRILALGQRFVARLDMSGNPDPSFGTGGVTFVSSSTPGTLGMSEMVIQPDGSILAVGSVDKGGGNYDLVLARLTPGGVPDTTFGGTGTITYNLGVDPPADVSGGEAPFGIHLTDGKILVACSRVVARFLSDGSLDTTYGAGGIVTLQSRGITGVFRDSALQADGKLVGVGEQGSPNKDFLVARFLGDSSTPSLMVSLQVANQTSPSMVGSVSEPLTATIGSEPDLTTLATELVRSRTKRPRLVGLQ